MKKALIVIAGILVLWYLCVAFSYDRERIGGTDFRCDRFTGLVEIKRMDGVWYSLPQFKDLQQVRRLRERNDIRSAAEDGAKDALDKRR